MLASVTLTLNVLLVCRPESKPLSMGVHGAARVDWVTECAISLFEGKVRPQLKLQGKLC